MKWEYAILTISHEVEARKALLKNMAIMGDQGWELVAVVDNMAFFKRLIRDVNLADINHNEIVIQALEGYFGGKIG